MGVRNSDWQSDVIRRTLRDVYNETDSVLNVRDIPGAVNATRSAFGEILESQLFPQAGWENTYNVNPDMVDSSVGGSGTVSFSSGRAQLSTGAAINSRASIACTRVLRYIPGVGGLARFTAVFNRGFEGSTQLIGLGDAEDGLFFGFNEENFGVMRRTGGTDYWTPQSSWNGTIPAAFNPAEAEGHVYAISYQDIGYGNIFFYIFDKDYSRFRLVHTIHIKIGLVVDATQLSIRSPMLPPFAEVRNTTNNSDITLYTPSFMAFTEGVAGMGPIDPLAFDRIFSGSQSVLAETTILSIQNPLTYEGILNRLRSQLTMLSISTDGTKPFTVRAWTNATLTGSPVYVDFDVSRTALQWNTVATTLSGGILVFEAQLSSVDSLIIGEDILSKEFGRSTELAPGETITFTGQTSSTSGDINATVRMTEKF